MGGVLATLFLAILICFASCDNGSTSSSSEKNSEELVSYELNGDAIKLYDDNTFVITLKENAGTISGTYSNLTSGHKLMVTKASGDIAKSGDILRLSVADGKVSVASSDITRYSTGDGGKVNEGTPPTTPSGGQGSVDSDKDNSLGDAPNGNRLSEDYFTDKKSEDGIYLEFTVPAGSQHFRVYIDGTGQVSEEIWRNESGNKGAFFYPFLTPDKEYAVRVVFLRDEDKDEEGYVIGHIGDGTIGWFETKVKAGANSKGEVRPKEHAEVKVENNGDFKFTKRPTFENENLLTGNGYDWMMDVALVEGVSWMHEGRKTKWGVEIEIPQKSITETHNLYTIEYYWKSDDFSKIDFVCYRPVLHYKYDGKEYKYLWYSDVMDTPELKTEEELYTDIDVKSAAAVAKIKGTWTYKNEWNDTNYFHVKVHAVYTNTLEIDDVNVKNTESRSYTKLDGSAFTIEELAAEKDWSWEWTYDNVPSEEAEEFENNLKKNPKFLKFEKQSYGGSVSSYKYTVRYLDDDNTLSNDKKTLVDEQEYQAKLSEDYKDNNSKTTRHWDFKLFEDEGSLTTKISGKDWYGKDYSYQYKYKKQ